MPAEPLTCPLCNVVVPPALGMAVGQRIACPRCGEAFTVTHLPLDVRITTQPALGTMTGAYRKPIRANRIVGGLVLGIMLLMAGIGLAYALATVQVRRDHDRALPRKLRKPWLLGERPGDTEANLVPSDLPGLGYLPSTTGVVAALQVEDLLASPAGKLLMGESWKVGDWDVSLATVKEWFGLPVEDIEHIVVGVDDDSGLTPPTHIIVRTRRSDGANRIRVKLKATRGKEAKTPEGGKRTIYSAKIGVVPVRVWPADDRTVVIGVRTDLERVPTRPESDIAHLSGELRETIENRLVAGVPFWVVGHSTKWKNTLLSKLMGQMKSIPLVDHLEEVRTFALWLVPAEPAKLGGAFSFANESTAAKVAKELEPKRKENPDTFKFSQAGPWIDVQQTLRLGRKR